jgi:hypothetical protein
MTVAPCRPGQILAARRKGAVTWQARISADRGRLEVVGLVPASATATTIEPLTDHELLELLGERGDPDDTEDADMAPSRTVGLRGGGVEPAADSPTGGTR